MSNSKADQSPKPESRPRVIVLGEGFAGIGAARKLPEADVDVVVIDGHDYHTFQPLPYQVATDLLPQGTVGHPLRDLFDDQPSAWVHTTEVTSVDLDKHEVGFAGMDPMGYDYLVLALGAEVNFFGVKGAAGHAFPLYTLADAVRLKEHILERWGAADKDPALIEDGALPGRTWADYLTLAVTEIREYGSSSIQVTRRLRAILEDLQESVHPEHRRQ